MKNGLKTTGAAKVAKKGLHLTQIPAKNAFWDGFRFALGFQCEPRMD